ncbi:MAG: hypothetical protein WCX12_03905 [Candidatus Paceibacterota bacterium]
MFSKKSEDELKRDTEILVIDDKKIELIRAIEKEGWKIKYLPDLDSYSNQYLKSSHILCIDILGVGKQLKCKDGMELVKNIKTHYPNIKIILYSSTSEHDIFDEILDIVDERIHKDGQPFPFLKAIKTLSANTFDWSSCTKSTYDKFKTEFGVEISYEEFEKKMRKLVEKKKLNNEDVAKILSCGKIGIEIVSVLSKFVE